MIDLADSNAVYYYHFDGLGSVVALTDASGQLQHQAERTSRRRSSGHRAISKRQSGYQIISCLIP